MNAKTIQGIVDRMRLFFVGSGLTAASRKTVEKWAKELEAALRAK